MMRIKLSKTWIIIIVIILIIIGYYITKSVFKSPTEGLIIEKVQKGEVLQEVSETGNIKATENVSLGFQTIGKIAKINVAVGDSVKKEDILAELDTSYTSAQLQSAEAVLDSANTQYNKLVNGLTPEDVKTYENAVTSAKQDLNNAYNGALNTLNNAYTAIFNAYRVVTTLKENYFEISDKVGIIVQTHRNYIDDNLTKAKSSIDQANSADNIDSAVSNLANYLNSTFNSLQIIRDQCDEGIYYDRVSTVDKSSLDAQKTYINTASISIKTLQNNISSYKTNLQTTENNLVKAVNSKPEDIGIYQSQIKQAQANINAIQSQLNDNYLTSPIDGKITEMNIKRGQVVSPSQSAIDLLSTEPFQIKVGIYEQDIINVKVGNDVKINLVAFPKQTFSGKVLSVDPAETIIDNVVYYEVTIDFLNQPDGIRSGMTADIIIETNKKDNVLRIPKNAVVQIDGTETVQVVKGNKIENRTIVTGLEGNDYLEVTSGIAEGDELVTGKK